MASPEHDHSPNPRPIAAKEIPLIDRTEEMKLLREAVDRTVHGEGGLIFLHGEAGIGKTRLARELRTYAHSQGMQVLYGRCPTLFRMDGVLPYVLWREVIRDYLDNSSLEQLYRVIGFYPAEVAKIVPELVQKLRAIPQSFPISPEQEQNRLFEAVSQFITNIAREAPLLVILDDLQWTDASSILLLHYLACGVEKTHLLLLGAFRSTDIDAKHPLSPVLTELNRERLSQSVSLKRMSLEDVSEMIMRIFEQDDVPAEFCSMVYEKTRGNPFFAEEVIKSLKEEGVIYREQSKWQFKKVSEIKLPETVRSVVKARIGRLDDECQNVLTMASLIGNEFTLVALQEVAALDEVKLRKIVDELLRTGLLKHRVLHGENLCSFADIVVRDVMYEEIGTFERKKLHADVGAALEKAYAEKVDEHLGELALHFLEGGDKDKALDYFLKAGEEAVKVHANHEGASYYQSAFGILEEKKAETRKMARVLEELGDIKKLMGEYDACIKCWNEAILLFKQLDERVTVARLHRRTANVLWSIQGDTQKAKIQHEEALAILQKEPEGGELASLLDDVARLYLREDVAKARFWAEKAIELAQKTNDYEALTNSYLTLGTATYQTGVVADREKAAEYGEKALRIALDNSLMEAALRAYSYLADYITEEGVKLLEKGYALAKKVGNVNWFSSFGTDLADAYGGMGDMNKAVRLLEESVALDRKVGNVNHLSYSLDELGWFYMVLGEWEKSEQHFKEALSLARKAKYDTVAAYTLWNIGQLHGEKGEYAKAKEQFEEAIEISEKTAAESSARFYREHLIWACMKLGEIEKARKLLGKLPKFPEVGREYWHEATEYSLWGRYFCAQKKWKESIEFWEKWLEKFEAHDARRWNVYWFAYNLRDYACVYMERDHEGDREKARNLLDQTLEIFQKIVAKNDVKKTMKLIEVLQPPKIQAEEKKTDLVGYVGEEVEGNIIASPRELKVGESLELEIVVKNTSEKRTIPVTKIAETIPEGFAVVKKPELSHIEGNCLILRDKELEPSKTEIVELVLVPKMQGTFYIRPKIAYLDENGKEKTCEPRPISITVKELGIKGWIKGER